MTTITNGTITQTCKEKDCNKSFTILPGEVKWLKEHGLEIFKRCPECRKRRREEAATKQEQSKVSSIEEVALNNA